MSHGKNQYFAVDDVGGVLRNLTPYLTSLDDIGITDAPVEDKTTMGNNSRKYERGIRSSSGSGEGLYDSTATSGPDVVLFALAQSASPTDFEYGPEGNGAGKVKYSGQIWIDSYVTGGDYDGLVPFSFSWTVEGDPVRGTFP